MSQLPARAHLDQLRRQARELHRAALGGDARALRRLRRVSGTLALSAAQLAIARDYGFASWPQLKAEVERRRAQAASPGDGAAGAGADQPVPGPAAVPPPKSWKQMRDWAAHLLRSRTGQDVAAWHRRVAAAGLPDEQALRAWLDSQGVTGYGQALLAWERFGYPDLLTAEADELIAGQYADRPWLRPVFDAVLAGAARGRPGDGAGPQDYGQPGHAPPHLRRDPGNGQEPGGPRPAAGARAPRRPPAGRAGSRRRHRADPADPARGRRRRSPRLAAARLRRERGAATAAPPARRPAPKLGALTVVIESASLPGLTFPAGDGGQYRNFHVGLATKSTERTALAVPGKPWRAADPVPGDAPSARWEAPVTVRRDSDGFDFSGPYVRGACDDCNLFLAWGEVRGDGTMRLVRGSKLKLIWVDPRLVEEAMRPGHRLVARIRLAGTAGKPGLTWSAEPAHAQPGSG